MHITGIRGAIRTQYEDRIQKPAVIWYGDNSTFKSARFEGFDLALTGERTQGKPEELIPPGADSASVAVGWVDESGIERVSTFHSGQTWLRVEGAPTVVRSANWLVHLGKARAREEIVARWGGEDIARFLVAPESLAEAQRKLWDAGIMAVRTEIAEQRARARKRGIEPEVSDDPATVLSELQSWARKTKLAKGKEARALETAQAATVDAGAPGADSAAADVAGFDDDPADLERRLAEAKTWEANAGMRSQVPALQAEIAAYSDACAAYQARPPLPSLEEDEAERETYAKRQKELEEKARALYAQIALLAAHPEACPTCFAAAAQGYDVQAAYARATEEYGQTMAALGAVGDNLERINIALAAKKLEHEARDSELANLHQMAALIQQKHERIAPFVSGAPYSGPTSQELQLRLMAAQKRQAARKLKEEQANQVYKIHAEQAVAKAVEVAAGIVLKTLTQRISDTLKEAVEAHLPDNLRGRFYLDIDSCQFMMVGADGRAHAWREQGESEYTALTLALALAWAGTSNVVLLLSYAHDIAPFDESTRAQVLQKIASAAYEGRIALVGLETPVPLPATDMWQVIHTGTRTAQLEPTTASTTTPAAPAVELPAPVAAPQLGTVRFDPDNVVVTATSAAPALARLPNLAPGVNLTLPFAPSPPPLTPDAYEAYSQAYDAEEAARQARQQAAPVHEETADDVYTYEDYSREYDAQQSMVAAAAHAANPHAPVPAFELDDDDGDGDGDEGEDESDADDFEPGFIGAPGPRARSASAPAATANGHRSDSSIPFPVMPVDKQKDAEAVVSAGAAAAHKTKPKRASASAPKAKRKAATGPRKKR